MQTSNPLKMNDWEIGSFLKVVGALLLAFLGITGLEFIGVHVPLLPQAIGFICLTFLPGMLILRILRLHNLSTIESLLYSVGLSVAFLMFIGLFINWLYPLIGISKPLSTLPLIATISIAMVIMCALSYKRDRGFSSPIAIDVKEFLSPPVLFLLLLPLLGILGALLVNFYNSNILLLVLSPMIAITVAFIAFDRFIPRKYYPLAVLSIAIALIYQLPLITPYLIGHDIMLEYYVYKLVETNSYWDWMRISTPYNTVLSDAILPTVYSSLLSIDGVWIFKVIYPLIYSLVPLGLYHAYRGQVGAKVAFLSAFFFMSFHFFFMSIPCLMRQAMGGFFVILLIMLVLDKKMSPVSRAALMIIFGGSLILSHHGVAYMWLFWICAVWLLLFFTKGLKRVSLTGASVALFLVMAFAWYLYISQSIVFTQMVDFGHYIYQATIDLFFVTEARSPTILKAIGFQAAPSLGYGISYWFYRVTQFFIVVGFLKLLFKRKEMRFEPEYRAFSVACMVLLVLLVVLPYFSKPFAPGRVYHLVLLILSPLCILGGEALFMGASRLFRSVFLGKSALKILVLVVLLPYFLFQTGFIFEVTGDIPYSIPLSMQRMEEGDGHTKARLYTVYIFGQDAASAKWLSENRDKTALIYSDTALSTHVLIAYGGMSYARGIYGLADLRDICQITPKAGEEAYIYLGYLNVTKDLIMKLELLTADRQFYTFTSGSTDEISEHFEARNLVYSNGGSEIYFGRPYGEE